MPVPGSLLRRSFAFDSLATQKSEMLFVSAVQAAANSSTPFNRRLLFAPAEDKKSVVSQKIVDWAKRTTQACTGDNLDKCTGEGFSTRSGGTRDPWSEDWRPTKPNPDSADGRYHRLSLNHHLVSGYEFYNKYSNPEWAYYYEHVMLGVYLSMGLNHAAAAAKANRDLRWNFWLATEVTPTHPCLPPFLTHPPILTHAHQFAHPSTHARARARAHT